MDIPATKLDRFIIQQEDGAKLQKVFSFPNGYGASVILDSYSYGLEMAVLKDGLLCYDTPITSDVIGYIANGEELEKLLEQVEQL